MRKFKIILAVIAPLFFTSCIIVDNTPGPYGRDGNAYFGIDYEHRAPYSYWDDNNSVPFDPILGEYYHTYPGVYEFEYFINHEDYYYGTYEVWTNQGGIGGSHGEPGYDGIDTYLMLITDPDGFHEHADGYGYKSGNNEPVVIEKKIGNENYKITIQKGNIKMRKAKTPKYIEK